MTLTVTATVFDQTCGGFLGDLRHQACPLTGDVEFSQRLGVCQQHRTGAIPLVKSIVLCLSLSLVQKRAIPTTRQIVVPAEFSHPSSTGMGAGQSNRRHPPQDVHEISCVTKIAFAAVTTYAHS